MRKEILIDQWQDVPAAHRAPYVAVITFAVETEPRRPYPSVTSTAFRWLGQDMMWQTTNHASFNEAVVSACAGGLEHDPPTNAQAIQDDLPAQCVARAIVIAVDTVEVYQIYYTQAEVEQFAKLAEPKEESGT